MASSSSPASSGVPPGFRFHPTDEELLLYYLKKKISLEKFDLEVIREIDLNKIEPWDLQERCRIGATPQNEWYFFSHKDRKYPTGSRTNRATNAGFWKATGRDKCIRNTYKKIGMRKTLVFYRGRAPHGQKTDWIMHEYRLEETDDIDQGAGSEDGWVVCRVFKKKCFFKTSGRSEGSSSQGGGESTHMNNSTSHVDPSRSLYMHQQQNFFHHHHQTANLYKHELALHYPADHHQMPTNPYSTIQVQDLLPNHRSSSGYDFSVLPNDSSTAMVKPYEVDGCEPINQHVGDHQGREASNANDWAMLDSMEGRYGIAGTASSSVGPMNQMPQPPRVGEMDLWGYGK